MNGRRSEAEEEPDVETGALETECPVCGAINEVNASECRVCGAEIPHEEGNNIDNLGQEEGSEDVPDSYETEEEINLNEYNYVECPVCGAKNTAGNTECMVCGAEIIAPANSPGEPDIEVETPVSEEDIETDTVPPSEETDTIECPICGAVNPIGTTECTVCGAELAVEAVNLDAVSEEAGDIGPAVIESTEVTDVEENE